MNWRNRQIFGNRFSRFSFLPTKIHIIGIILLIIIGIGGWIWLANDDSNANPLPSEGITGATVIQQEQEEQETTEEQDTEPILKEEEEREFYEYKGECAKDMKTRQDDIADINSQISEYNQQLQALQEEYDRKKQELEEEYLVPKDNAQRKKEKAERDLTNVEDKWIDRKAFCDRKYPG